MMTSSAHRHRNCKPVSPTGGRRGLLVCGGTRQRSRPAAAATPRDSAVRETAEDLPLVSPSDSRQHSRRCAKPCAGALRRLGRCRVCIDVAGDPGEIERFLRVTQGTAIGTFMRTDFVEAAGKTGDWARFCANRARFRDRRSEIAWHRRFAGATRAAVQEIPAAWRDERLTEACADALRAGATERVSTDDAGLDFRSSADGATPLAASRVAEAMGERAPSASVRQRAHASPDAALRTLRCNHRRRTRSKRCSL